MMDGKRLLVAACLTSVAICFAASAEEARNPDHPTHGGNGFQTEAEAREQLARFRAGYHNLNEWKKPKYLGSGLDLQLIIGL